MTSIHELRASIDKLLDRWEDSASTLEQETSAAIAGLAVGVADEKRKVGQAVEELERAIAGAKDLPAVARERLLALLAAIARDVIAAKVATHQQMLEQRQRMKQAFRDLQECLGQLDQRVAVEIEKAVLRLLLAAKELELKFEILLVRFAAAHVDEMVGLAARMKAIIDQIAAFRQAVSAGWSAAAGQGEDAATQLVVQFDRAKELFRKTFDDLAR
jgi:uncharacterized protein YoxC